MTAMKGFIESPQKENLDCTCGLETNIKILQKELATWIFKDSRGRYGGEDPWIALDDCCMKSGEGTKEKQATGG